MATIIYTHTDEAPLLATYSFLPIIQAYAATGRRGGRDPRHLAGRPDHRPVPRAAHRRAARSTTRSPSSASWPRRPRPTSSSCPTSPPRSRSSRPRSPSCRSRATTCPTTPTTRQTDEEQGRPRPLRQGQGQRGQPGPARGQLRPPRADVGQELRPQAPALDGRLERRLEDQRRARWAPTTSAPTRSPWSSSADDTLRIELVGRRRHHDRAQGVRAGAGRRGRRRHRHAASPRCATFLAEQIARAKAEDVLFSVHLKATMMKVSDPIIFGHVVQAFFPDVFAQYGEQLAAAGLTPNDGLGGILAGLDALRGRRRDQGGRRGRASPTARAGDGRLRQGHHQPARAVRRHRRRLDAGDDPHLRPHVGPRRRGGRHPRGDPRLVVRRHLPGRHRRLPRQRRLRPGHDGLGAQRRADGAGGRGVRLPRQDLRDPRRRHRARRRRRRRRRCSSTTSRPGDIWRACQTKDVPIRDWVKLAVTRARATGAPAVFWLDETRAHDANLIAKVNDVPPRARHRRPRHPDPGAGRGDRVLPRADPQGRGHHLGHRQRAARLPHRPVPDPRARHQRQDALGRAADQRRRPVRDRRRRLGAQARAAAGQGELPALGQPRRVPRAGRVSFEHLAAEHGQRRARRCSPTPSTGRPARSSTRTSRRPARSARSTTAARTSTSRSTGPRSWRSRPTTPSSPRTFAALAEALAENEQTITEELIGVQGQPGRHRRLLPARRRQGRRGDAPVEDVQRGARLALTAESAQFPHQSRRAVPVPHCADCGLGQLRRLAGVAWNRSRGGGRWTM